MRRLVFAALLFLSSVAYAEYTPRSPYLQDPDLNIALQLDIADFWKSAKDATNGGFYSYVNPDGTPGGSEWRSWNAENPDCLAVDNYKSVTGQSRVAYVFARAFMLSGDTTYLELARHALRFLYAHGWDDANGGWYFNLDQYGNLGSWLPECFGWNPNTSKWGYQQLYPLVGIAAMCEATGERARPAPLPDPIDWRWLEEGLVSYENLYDVRQGYEGYYLEADLDWSNPRMKGFTTVIDSFTTHASAVYLLSGQLDHRQRLLALANQAAGHLVASMDEDAVQVGFPEQFDADWNIDPQLATGDVGHLLKTAWVLARAYLVSPRNRYKEGARKLIHQVWEKAYDHVHGGPFLQYDWQTGAITEGKDYWMLEQAVVAGLVNRYIADSEADRDLYLEMADESLAFYVDHLVDPDLGGHWFRTNNDGSVITDPTKGNVFDQGYHASELNYYSYLYGNLLYLRRPVTLFYLLSGEQRGKVIQLNPLEIENGLVIRDVELDGKAFTRFSARERTLSIPARVAGVFKVTFELRARSR
jgi:mannose/cellobiose epimerase-like protein (N-acyl-D-glucosamine 2-epimerase family)